MKYLQNLFKEKGRDANFDNRNRAVKQLNTLIHNGDLKINIARKGYYFKNKKGTEYVASVIVEGRKAIVLNKGTLTPYRILDAVGLLLTKDEVVKIKIQERYYHSHTEKCSKCNGTGQIPQFFHYAKGVCFDCMGSGIKGFTNIELKK